jgi:hypothetical protein
LRKCSIYFSLKDFILLIRHSILECEPFLHNKFEIKKRFDFLMIYTLEGKKWTKGGWKYIGLGGNQTHGLSLKKKEHNHFSTNEFVVNHHTSIYHPQKSVIKNRLQVPVSLVKCLNQYLRDTGSKHSIAGFTMYTS